MAGLMMKLSEKHQMARIIADLRAPGFRTCA